MDCSIRDSSLRTPIMEHILGILLIGGVKEKRVLKSCDDTKNMRLCLINRSRYRQSLWITLIGTCIHPAYRYYFQWPWATPNPDFTWHIERRAVSLRQLSFLLKFNNSSFEFIVFLGICWCSSADGKYEVSYKPNVVIHNDGDVLWIPPAIYRSSCPISVRYFPFDEQECEMKFGSWTFNSDQVTLKIKPFSLRSFSSLHLL